MKNLAVLLSVLSCVGFVLADIPPTSNGGKQNNEGICLGFGLILMAIAVFIGWLLRKKEFWKNE
jgi:hypothetical protein